MFIGMEWRRGRATPEELVKSWMPPWGTLFFSAFFYLFDGFSA
jgi:hypothetical protein